jgi:SNF family Na+-dependent transporter
VAQRKQWASDPLFVITAVGSKRAAPTFRRFTYLAGQNGGDTIVTLYFIAVQ